MKKIVFVIGSLVGGGSERVLTTVASFLAELGDFNISILTYYKEEKEYYISPKINRINISNGDRKKYNELSPLKKLKIIRKKIKEIDPDYIVCFLSNPYVFTYIALSFSKYKKRITYCERANPKHEKNKTAKLRDILSKHSNVITQNRGQISCFPKTKNISVIPNPMYNELFENKKEYLKIPKRIVSVGRLTNQKNYELSIKAFYEVQKKYSDLEYYIYGDGNKKDEIIALINSLGLQDKVHLMGFEHDRNKIYGDKDIFLMTSLFEGMPNTLAEAMCYGIPSISTNCEFGPADLILDDNMGILLDDYEVSSVSNALFKIIENYDDYIIKAKYARKVLRNKYSYEEVMNKWKEYFIK